MEKKDIVISILGYLLFVLSSSVLGILYLSVGTLNIFIYAAMYMCSIYCTVKVVKNTRNLLFYILTQGIVSAIGYIAFYYAAFSIRDASPFPFMAIGSIVYFVLALMLLSVNKIFEYYKLESYIVYYLLSFILFVIATIFHRIIFLI